MSLVSQVFEVLADIARENGLSRIQRVTLQIGNLRQVVPEMFQFAFDSAKHETAAAGSELVMEFLPVKIECPQCGINQTEETTLIACPSCGRGDVEVVQGKELLIKTIEGEERDSESHEKHTSGK